MSECRTENKKDHLIYANKRLLWA